MAKPANRIRPSRNPQTINENIWYYERRGGIDFVVWCDDGKGRRLKAVQFKVPKKMLLATIARIDAPQPA